ncbi:DNA cytosine methyltransferase [Gammaproteobacteria bacterium]|nr:DNA cytosine methyltransferase [Gammaproteobacteria bacterium]
MNHIELFAGCGGLSLGLETEGFELLMANELSPMASETFAFNLLGTDLDKGEKEKVYWISSDYKRDNIYPRLRENPQQAAGVDNKESDLLSKALTNNELRRCLLVGSIIDLNKILQENPRIHGQFTTGFGNGGVDLVSGGPPCQSFSLAGLRDHTNSRNKLPWEFAQFVKNVQPKSVILENVSGIMRAFKIGQTKYYAWHEVAKAFAEVGYVPICLHVNAKFVGAAQNRPRFIMLAFRYNDIFAPIEENNNDPVLEKIFKQSKIFYEKVNNPKNSDPEFGSLTVWDVEKHEDVFSHHVFSHLRERDEKSFSTVKDAIDDLRSDKVAEKEYIKLINESFVNPVGRHLNKLRNHDPRNNNNKVRARFRLYQRLQKIPKEHAKNILDFIKSSGDSKLEKAALKSLERDWLLNLEGKEEVNPKEKFITELLLNLFTKKQTQRALIADKPAPAALSIPDDACHYHESKDMQRTLTVREMARIQSFPDWFEVRSKVTTGGKMRKFEVPQYTQMGNAVPPLLGKALGKVVKNILKLANN